MTLAAGIHTISADLTVIVPAELLDVSNGEVLPATADNAVTVLFAAREMRAKVMGIIKDAEAVLLEESRRQGTKTLHLAGGTATVTGGSDTEWDVAILGELLNVGLPDGRWGELYVATVTYKVDARVAKQLAAANPDYAEIIGRARSTVEKAWRVSVK